MKITAIEAIGPVTLPDGDEILTTTYTVESDDAVAGDNPVLVTFSVNPTQRDPEEVVEALREIADQLDEAIDAFYSTSQAAA